ncbi:MAG: undecaprenyl-diphosphate phosphatase [Acidimicrobiaceae bacterium]|nr:undecaprenyl-diphosphate phosphatase [Acidimicrobiaceae bacterium]MCY4280637.1 undecaprenyl-diphosphate phosphatase [Acidimicrobiaceae bacterium]MCY4293412.1 undecaprenyl-diphosphate phosphatase [Acidimicrobiaceae bacterium]
MPILHAVVLGVVQGLSEFLPVSSSGHLVLVRWLLGWDELTDEAATAFDVAVHVGTLTGAAAYLRADIRTYSAAALAPVFGDGPLRADGRVGWSLLVSAVPAGIAGVVAGEALRGSQRIAVVALALIVFGLLLGASDRLPARHELRDFGPAHALVMGLGQALALQPGVSRSGAAITVARGLGYDRGAAVRLAFLMSLPVIAGAGAYGFAGLSIPSGLWPALGWGAGAAMITGWVSVWATVQIVGRVSLRPFVAYRVLAGCLVLALAAAGLR